MVVLGSGKTLWIAFEGVLDAAAVARDREALERLAEVPSSTKLVIGLERVQRIDPSGIALVVSLLCRARERGGRARVEGLHGQPARVFEVLRLPRAA